MKKVLAALDNSLAGKALLEATRTLAALLDAEVQALHVQTDGDRTARGTAEAADISFRTTEGPVVERLVEAGGASDVVALAIGARGSPSARSSLGGTASAVASALPKPVMIVPPDAEPPEAFRRVLVPIEGLVSSTLTPGWFLSPPEMRGSTCSHCTSTTRIRSPPSPTSRSTSNLPGRTSSCGASAAGEFTRSGSRPGSAEPARSSRSSPRRGTAT